MRRLRDFFFILINLAPAIHSISQNCPVSSCGNSYFSIQYPFILQDQHPQICSNYTVLGCTHWNITFLNLPSSGEFFVSEISYSTRTVQLYDPGNCLPRRLMNLSLSSSIFTSAYYQNYTFYRCAKGSLFMSGLTPIDCLSSYVDTVVASSSASPTYMSREHGCEVIATARLPVSWLGQFDNIGIYSDLQLTWDVPRCQDCDQYPETGKGRSPIWSKIVRSPFFFPSVTFLSIILITSCLICCKKIGDRNRAPANNVDAGDVASPPLAAAALSPHPTGGATTDDPKVDSYTISVIVEEKSGTLGSTCAICLEDYRKKEKIKCIILCHHCFHANCIDQWLQKSWSCPVCRISLSS